MYTTQDGTPDMSRYIKRSLLLASYSWLLFIPTVSLEGQVSIT